MSYDEEFFNELFEDITKKHAEEKLTEIVSFSHPNEEKTEKSHVQNKEEETRYIFVS